MNISIGSHLFINILWFPDGILNKMILITFSTTTTKFIFAEKFEISIITIWNRLLLLSCEKIKFDYSQKKIQNTLRIEGVLLQKIFLKIWDLSPSLPFMLPFKFAPTLQTKYQGLIGCERNFECQYFQIWSFAENKNKWHTFFYLLCYIFNLKLSRNSSKTMNLV